MSLGVDLVEVWRGDLLESVHQGHAVICDASGQIVESWGNPAQVIYPRSSCKMIQALPLVESGAAATRRLTPADLALACASHQGAAIHTNRVRDWLAALGLDDAALRCGPQMPDDRPAREGLIKSDTSPCQVHNNCSGKHTGFLTLSQHLGGDAEYDLIDHPVQQAVKAAFEEVTDETSVGWARDGCSAPNHTCSLHGLARAMAAFAAAQGKDDTRSRAATALYQAMVTHPDLVAGDKRACTELMQAMQGRAAIKTGAEGVFVAIVPEKQLGVALKIADGTTRAANAAIAALLVRLGVLDPVHPAAQRHMTPLILNRRGFATGVLRPAAALS